MNDLSPLVKYHVERLFPPSLHEEVSKLLREDCGEALRSPTRAGPQYFERVQCAALKLSEGRLDKLYDAIALAQTDWRDLLVNADFALTVDSYKDWR